jgi:uncharacterized membrane protein HdeD (DUF308 family)
MNSLFQVRSQDIQSYWGWFLAWGVALVVLGTFAITASVLTTMVTIIMLGLLILMSGILIVIDTFAFWWGKWRSFLLHMMIGLLYLVVGYMLLHNPSDAAESITLLLGIFYVVIGTVRVISSLSAKLPRWSWLFFNGLVSLVLGILILSSWPASSLFIIGLFIGIDLLVCGWTYIMLALGAKAIAKH